MINLVTQELLKEYFEYDPDSGQFIRIKKRSKKDIIGTYAGSVARAGNIDIRFFGLLHRAHRLAWLYMTGEWPHWTIDHINGNPIDNRRINLRDVPHNANLQNMKKANRNNDTGYLGVTKHKGRFRARIKVDYKIHHLGVFDTAKEAHVIYLSAKRKLHKGCTI